MSLLLRVSCMYLVISESQYRENDSVVILQFMLVGTGVSAGWQGSIGMLKSPSILACFSRASTFSFSSGGLHGKMYFKAICGEGCFLTEIRAVHRKSCCDGQTNVPWCLSQRSAMCISAEYDACFRIMWCMYQRNAMRWLLECIASVIAVCRVSEVSGDGWNSKGAVPLFGTAPCLW